MNSENPAVLCVDDEPAVLHGLSLHLRRGFRVTTAQSAAEGLERLSGDDFAVVISDMRMPGMDGAAFLGEVRAAAPSAVRMLLTGYADLQAATRAVNQGQIFRFLTKPCPPSELRAAVDAGVRQHRLVNAERVLLEQTLRGSVDALIDILALTSPVVFGRANRLKRHVAAVAERLGIEDRWQVEVAAMLSQVGFVTLPDAVAEKMYAGGPLTEDEKHMVAQAPQVLERLLGRIPRMDGVLDIVVQSNQLGRRSQGAAPSIGARLLRIARDYDEREARGDSPVKIFASMKANPALYDQKLVAAFAETMGQASSQKIQVLPTHSIRPGMILAEDVRLNSGVLFLSRGHTVTESLLRRVMNLPAGAIDRPLAVIVPESNS